MNDIWRLFDLPGNKVPSEYADITQDEMYQYMISVGLIGSSLVYPIEGLHTNNLLLGIGALIGTRMANTSERGSIHIFPTTTKKEGGITL